jgi:hypothetical protein
MRPDVMVAIDDEALRTRVVGALSRAGVPALPASTRDLANLEDVDQVVVLFTDNDVAYLSQLVYGVYLRARPRSGLRWLTLLSRDAVERNPSIGGWVIEGHAAVAGVVWLDDSAPSDRDLVAVANGAKRLLAARPTAAG